MSSIVDSEAGHHVEPEYEAIEEMNALFSDGNVSGDRIEYSAIEERAHIVQAVGQFTEKLKMIWDDEEAAQKLNQISLTQILKYKSLPAFFKEHFRGAFLTALVISIMFSIAGAVLVGFFYFNEMLDTQSLVESEFKESFVMILLTINALLIGGTIFIQQQKLNNNFEKINTRIAEVESKIKISCTDFIISMSAKIDKGGGAVEGSASDDAKSKRVKIGLVYAITHWRALERMAHYARHKWDMFVRDCRDEIYLPDNAWKRQIRYVPELAFASLLIVVGGWIFYETFKLSGIEFYLGSGIGVLFVSISLLSIGLGLWGVRKHKEYSVLILVRLTEALQIHKKKSAIKIVGIDYNTWIRLTKRNKKTGWEGWTPEYEDRQRVKLREELTGSFENDEELEIRINQLIESDEVMFIGENKNIRFRILQHDPLEHFVNRIPHKPPR